MTALTNNEYVGATSGTELGLKLGLKHRNRGQSRRPLYAPLLQNIRLPHASSRLAQLLSSFVCFDVEWHAVPRRRRCAGSPFQDAADHA